MSSISDGGSRRVLVLGGTGWLGSEIAAAAASDGAEVVCLARGETGAAPEGVRFVRADRRDPGAYRALRGAWDEVVDLASDPALVASAVRALGDRAAHWTFVSTISVYRHADRPDADESAALVEPEDLGDYAQAKVAAERAAAATLGDRLLVVRPGLIVGPGDRSDRFGYWPARLHRGGRVVTPQLAGRAAQFIDVADLAGWIVRAGRARLVAVVDAVGPSRPLAELLREASAVTGFRGEFVEVDDAALLAAGVAHWAGPRSLPLWLPADAVGFARRSGAAYLAAGGTVRPLRDTLARVLADELARDPGRPRRAGLTADDEAEVLARLR